MNTTTLETGLEEGKARKIAQMAEQAAALATELGQQPEAVRIFLQHYFRHVDAADMRERSLENLFGLVERHYRLALVRTSGRPSVDIALPGTLNGLGPASGTTVVQIVTDDQPFLVDSVTMEVLRQGWTIREVFHPQFLVRREPGGQLLSLVQADHASAPEVTAESWMHLEIAAPGGADDATRTADALRQGLLEVLGLVREVVQDWAAMTTRSEQTIELLQDPVINGGRTEEATLASELLQWFGDNHFTFLGYREYRYDVGTGSDGAHSLVPVPGTGLGLLRGDEEAPGAFAALPLLSREQSDGEHPLMVITKDDHKSRVHRPAYLDYVGIRSFAEGGQVTGERRFLGLFASAAYSEAVLRVPVLRQKATEVLRRSGYDAQSHGGKAILDVLDSYPRDELFQTSIDELTPIVEKVAHLKERRQVRLFVRRDVYGRYLSCLVFLPRDRYTTSVRAQMQGILMTTLGGGSVDYTARVTESVLARLHFVVRMPVGHALQTVDVGSLERELTAATRSWDDEFADALNRSGTDRANGKAEPLDFAALTRWAAALPEGYKEDYQPHQGVLDLLALGGLQGDTDMSLVIYTPDNTLDEADLRLKIIRRDASLSLSKVLPHLSLLGVDVIDERPYELLADTERAFIYDFGLVVPGGAQRVATQWDAAGRTRFIDAFSASYAGRSEPDAFHALVMQAELDWRQVSVLRAIGRYLRQAGSTYSQTYLASALSANVDVARLISRLFETRFDPSPPADAAERARRADALVTKIRAALDNVASLAHDRILRSYLSVVTAVVRTNAFQQDRQALALKMLPAKIPDLPEPRPQFEIFVYSPRVEGVHLRFGRVARGGLRWSDRAEDFRTEVLGLVKAQMVKNTVIVPVGAKGGFYAKRLPDPTVDRDAWLAEGVACYQLFVTSLLDVTDNLVDGAVVSPVNVIRYDGDDPYLVVAADKGTATFSDIANEISTSAGFWLGDAFASGGSAGYDHKAMGITARGAWESVVRHFREMGLDCQSADFTCVGIGDMSGDVFGNGMLLSRHLGLVAAFDHRHIFLDPHPDLERSWAERARLFALRRSSWADYDASLISAGGGVFSRSLKAVPLTPEVRDVLGIGAEVASLSPAELISACLRAPVDLLWNGGIGTYVKASTEDHAAAGDKANDGLRVDGRELRARCVGEGGNLGLTQLGRIEYASAGGRINTDFIDNSAGVDTSDHEVNIKILLESELSANRLTRPERDTFLESMTDEVAELVLAHNRGQNLALANAVHQAGSMAGVHEDWMTRLEDRGLLDRGIEFLPSTEVMESRRAAGLGLTAPELATLMAYTKIVLAREVEGSDLPDDPYLVDRLVDYFPTAMRQRYAHEMTGHRLHREIITTELVNDFVNESGISCFHRLSAETGAPAGEVIRAQVAARAIFRATEHDRAVRALDHRVDAALQTELALEARTLVERATRWLINNRRRPIDIGAAVTDLSAGVQAVQRELPNIVVGRELETYSRRLDRYRLAGVDEPLAVSTALLPATYAALSIVQIANRTGLDVLHVALVHVTVGQRLGLDRLLARIIELPREDRWQTMARAALRDDLHGVHAQLTAQVLAVSTTSADGASAEALVSTWEDANPLVGDSVTTLRSVCQARPDLARMSVGLRVVRGLLPAAV
ncbi:MAG TPA: NAD-glutamate dehydrogenase [Propionibacteriaceae bacterium]|nr:NAD-glutamate dehydrogenase [Propionibacteriaceae bacterium]